MRIFAEKHNPTRTRLSNNPARSLTSSRPDPLTAAQEAPMMARADAAAPATRVDYSLGRMMVNAPVQAGTRRTLAVTAPGDIYEREARNISEHAMHSSGAAELSGCARAGGCPPPQGKRSGAANPSLQTRRIDSARSAQLSAPAIVHRTLLSPGQPLDPATRTFAEPLFGHDFGHVRVHTDATASRSAEAVRAHAYTVGRDVVFAPGKYAPATASGRRLLMHELAHVLQQEGSAGAPVLQRSEVDDRSCAGLTDIEPDIDANVNREISDERSKLPKPVFGPLLALHVMQQLGGRSPVSPIENFVESLPPSKRTTPPNTLAGTKYRGAEAVNRFYELQVKGVARVVGPAAKIHGICVGADKLGHFFDQGFDFLQEASKPGATPADVENLGRVMEMGTFGLATTGVFSNADIAANRAGMQFYKDLQKNPDKFTFHIRNYISRRWNEQANPSFYTKDLGSVVWSNLVTGQWQGTIRSGGMTHRITFHLTATPAGDVTGTFEVAAHAGPGKPRDIVIKAGRITQRTTSISGTLPSGSTETKTPVSGISIEFEWERGTDSGKGRLDSIDEQTLRGTIGRDLSVTGLPVLHLKKT